MPTRVTLTLVTTLAACAGAPSQPTRDEPQPPSLALAEPDGQASPTAPTVEDLDAEARRLFAPVFATNDQPFDVNKTLFQGKPVAELIETASRGSGKERADAIIGLYHVHHGCEDYCRHSGWSGPSRDEGQRMLYLAQHGRIGPRASALLPVLIKAMEDPAADVRRAAAFTLMSMNGEALAACDALQAHLDDPDTRVRLWTARALYSIRFDTDGPIAASVSVLRDGKETDDRLMAAYNLDLMGSDAKAAIPDLQRALSDASVRSQVEQALESIRR